MSKPELDIRYHSKKMLLTLDIGMMVDILLEEYGEPLVVRLIEMTQSEQYQNEDHTGPVTIVVNRFYLHERHAEGTVVRREDLEERIIYEGRK